MTETLDQAQAVIDKHKQETVEKCEREVTKILEKYKCVFSFSLEITSSGQIFPKISLLIKE